MCNKLLIQDHRNLDHNDIPNNLCLACKGYVVYADKFCTHCGTKWEGEVQVSERHKKLLGLDSERAYGPTPERGVVFPLHKEDDPRRAHETGAVPIRDCRWVVESRTNWSGKWTRWTVGEWGCFTFDRSWAKDAIERVKKHHYDADKREYRLKLVPVEFRNESSWDPNPGLDDNLQSIASKLRRSGLAEEAIEEIHRLLDQDESADAIHQFVFDGGRHPHSWMPE